MDDTPKTGDRAACASCGNDIIFVGPHWDHVGELKPRHSAFPQKPNPTSGLVLEEQAIMKALLEAWHCFKTLTDVHQDDKRDFIEAIHRAQQVLMSRVVRRDYPDFWR